MSKEYLKKIIFFFQSSHYRKIIGEKSKISFNILHFLFLCFLIWKIRSLIIIYQNFIDIYRKLRLLMSTVTLFAFEEPEWHLLPYRLTDPQWQNYFFNFCSVWGLSTNWVISFYRVEVDPCLKVRGCICILRLLVELLKWLIISCCIVNSY